MAKRQYVSIDQNPIKNQSKESIAQFSLVVKNGDINEIRNYVINNQIVLSGMYDKLQGSPINSILMADNKSISNSNKLEIIEYLEKNGVPFDIPDGNNVRPIHLAAQMGSPKIVDFLISKGANLASKDSSGNTPLHYAVRGTEITCPSPHKIP